MLTLARWLVQPQVRTPLDDEQLRRILADQVWTPVASFHDPHEVAGWLEPLGWAVTQSRRSPLYSFTLVAEPVKPSRRRDAAVARTRAHYERYPFLDGGEPRQGHWRRRLARHLPCDELDGATVLDAGCGSGDIARTLTDAGAQVTGIDLTAAATRRTAEKLSTACVAQASVLALPFRDGTFDYAVSIGVLHHTPSVPLGLAELARVTRGRIVVLLYRRWTPYHLAYVLATPLRRIDVGVLDRVPAWLLRPASVAISAQRGQRLAPEQIRCLLADQFWTPTASFHSLGQLDHWASISRLHIVSRQGLLCHAYLVGLERVPSSDGLACNGT
jgi:2-polyprenyl-3-methyl-5-hydroxy-6-metoxy-1,4-benzoquinol methylase